MSSPYDGRSTTQSIPGISGENTTNGTGVSGSSQGGYGVEAISTGGVGLHAKGQVHGSVGPVEMPGQAALFDGSVVVNGNTQVNGSFTDNTTSGTAISGRSDSGTGVSGSSGFGTGVEAISTGGIGLHAIGQGLLIPVGPGQPPERTAGNAAVFDGSVVVNGPHTVNGNAQVTAQNQLGLIVQGPNSGVGAGLQLQSTGAGGIGWELLATGATSAQGAGKFNIRDLGTGSDNLTITSDGNVGIGTTTPNEKLTVNGRVSVTTSGTDTGYGVEVISGDAGLHAVGFTGNAALFDGSVVVNGNHQVNGTVSVTVDIILTNADCAEEFDVAEAAEVEPGTVMVLDRDGALQPSQQAYDKKVAGVISGAGDYKPGLILDKKESSEGRMPVALVGKVYCKVDADYAPIEMGDLLTTSPTLGHAMKADDPFKAFGAVIGKALRPLEAGQGLIPILVALQ
jgi:hypothetical protein